MENVLGNNLRLLRAARQLTQSDVARKIGVASSTYGSFESGHRKIGEAKLRDLAMLFGVSVEFLLQEQQESEILTNMPAARSKDLFRGSGLPLRACLVGLGRINLGLMGPMLNEGGFEVCGVNLVHKEMPARHQSTVESVNKNGFYLVRRVDHQTETRQDIHVPFGGAFAFDENAPQNAFGRRAIEEAAKCQLIVSGVGAEARAQEKCANFLYQVIKRRISADCGPLEICGCENPMGLVFASAYLRNRILDNAAHDSPTQQRSVLQHIRHYVRFPLLLVDRICSERRVQSGEPVMIVTERYGAVMASDTSCFFKYMTDNRSQGRFELCTDLESYRVLKTHILNCGHAMAAYCGHFSGCQTIDEAVRKKEIRYLIETALDQVAEALKRRGGLPDHEIVAYRSTVIPRLANRLGDRIRRVARDPLRKLHRSDRLLGTALLVLYNLGHVSEELSRAIAAAFAYGWEYDHKTIDPTWWIEENELDYEAMELKQKLGSHRSKIPMRLTGILEQECGLGVKSLKGVLQRGTPDAGADFERLLVQPVLKYFEELVFPKARKLQIA